MAAEQVELVEELGLEVAVEGDYVHDELQVERSKWLLIFPMEIWNLIFEHLNDVQAIKNCDTASPFFKDLVDAKRTVYLYPQVLDILEKQQYIDTYNFTYRELLLCRRVCTGWKRAADNILESRPYHKTIFQSHRRYGLYNEPLTDATARIIFKIYDFTLNKLENKIMPALNTPYYIKTNPFPTRHLEIWERCISEEKPETVCRYRKVTEKLLERVGHHIWHVQIQILAKTPSEWYSRLWTYASLMPNLKTLCVSCGFSRVPEHCLKALPFPTLENCYKLTFDSTHDGTVNAIMGANKHAKVVEVMLGGCCSKRSPINMSLLEDPHSVAVFVRTPKEFMRLPENWNLKILRVDFVHSTNFLDWGSIFLKLSCLKDTLVELMLNLPYAKTYGSRGSLWESSKTVLNLPKLKRLQVEVHGCCTIDFLLGLKSLQHLKLWIWHIERMKAAKGSNPIKPEVIQFNDTFVKESRFKESNIWQLIPSLKVVELRGEYGKRFYRSSTNEIIRSG